MSAPVNAAPELEADLQLQASSPAQDKSVGSEQTRADWGGRPIEVNSDSGEQHVGEQATEPKGVSKTGGHPKQVSEQRGEQSLENGESDERLQLADNHSGEEDGEHIRSEHSTRKGEQRGEQNYRSPDDRGEQLVHKRVSKDKKEVEQPAQVILLAEVHRQRLSPSGGQTPDEQSAQWLKSILPEASNGNGWWDVRTKPKRFVLMFRWRDPDLQVITLQGVTREEFETLKRIGSEDDSRDRIREQIAVSLRKCSLDPARCDKALVVAEKLGIDLSIPNVPSLMSKEL
jgi:hypothetical protein